MRLDALCAGREEEFGQDGVEGHVSEVGFDNVSDAKRRDYFNTIRTDLELSKNIVQDARRLGGSLLLECPRYQDLLADLKGGAAAVE